MGLLRVQIHAYDSYQGTMGGLTRPTHAGLCYAKVPVLRVFGALPLGHSVLVHIHNVYPYVYLPCEATRGLLRRADELRVLLERKLHEAHRRQPADDAPLLFEYVAGVSVVSATPLYGFHPQPQLFYKVYLLHPLCISRLATVLAGTPLQPHELHIPYTSQFVVDFNLYGCGWLQCDQWRVRLPVVNSAVVRSDKDQVLHQVGRLLLSLDPAEFPRMGTTAVEIDIDAAWIANRLAVQPSLLELFSETTGTRLPLVARIYADLERQRQAYGVKPAATPTQINTRVAEYVPPWSAEFTELVERAVVQSRDMFRRLRVGELTLDSVLRQRIERVPGPLEEMSRVLAVRGEREEGKGDGTAAGNEHGLEEGSEEPEGESEPEEDAAGRGAAGEDAAGENAAEENAAGEGGSADEDGTEDNAAEEDDAEEDGAADMLEVLTPQTPPDLLIDLLILRLTQSQRLRIQLGTEETPSLAKQYRQIAAPNHPVYAYSPPPSNAPGFLDSLESHGLVQVEYPDPFYSTKADVPSKPFIRAGRKFQVGTTPAVPPIQVAGRLASAELSSWVQNHRVPAPRWFSYAQTPPSAESVLEWCLLQTARTSSALAAQPVIPVSPPPAAAAALESSDHVNLATLTMELLAGDASIDREPDAAHDAILMVCYHYDDPNGVHRDTHTPHSAILVVGSHGGEDYEELKQYGLLGRHAGVPVLTFPDEVTMANRLFLVVLQFDPDILCGYEVHSGSWGFLALRLSKAHNIDLYSRVGRVVRNPHNKRYDRYGYTHGSGMRITGRHMLNVWRHMRHEAALTSYTLENCCWHMLKERVAHVSAHRLVQWVQGLLRSRLAALRYLHQRVRLCCRLLQLTDLVARTLEEARVLGIDFYLVLTRGSQFKVELFLARLSKQASYIMVLPSKQQVQQQKPLECIPLVMEPQLAYYKSPLLVLDFALLYPSVMSAFNYCYSTVIGQLRGFKPGKNKVGVVPLSLIPGVLHPLRNHLTVAPTGVMFVDLTVRKLVLATMVEEILEARVAVKQAMKETPLPLLKQTLYARQLALKLIANVTYGYTLASYSGRMPCLEVADAIVLTGRELLLQLIDAIEKGAWGAKVVYGDTDLLFVYLPGKTRAEAFRAGRDIARQVTAMFPSPVKLKFEKVYHPCVLVLKKRYVGYLYEHEQQATPMFDAKGIETVRRDGVPAAGMILEHLLRLLFELADLSLAKRYVQQQLAQVARQQLLVHSLCFAKEVRMGTYRNPQHLPPGAVVAGRAMDQDANAEPQYRQRVPYVIVKGEAKLTVRLRARLPRELLADRSLELDSDYYITRVLVPPLQRVFGLVGADVKEWERGVPREGLRVGKTRGIGAVVGRARCRVCQRRQAQGGENSWERWVCGECAARPMELVLALTRARKRQRGAEHAGVQVCRDCLHTAYGDTAADHVGECSNYDCPQVFRRVPEW